MTIISHLDWLRDRVGRDSLPDSAFRASMEFAILWAYFEGQTCAPQANSKKLRDFAKDLYARKHATLERKLEPQIEYFKGQAPEISTNPDTFISLLGGPTYINATDRQSIIDTLTKSQLDEVDKAIGLLLICYRVRNNLFHGAKLIPALQQQEQAFVHTGQVLRTLLDAR